MKILLIAGHGAGDCGAVGNGYKEADLTREIVKMIASKLRSVADVSIYDTNRNAFKDVRTGNFKIGQYDYALEVHFNAYNGVACGTEVYVTSLEKGIGVENAIMKRLGSLFAVRGVKVKNYTVIHKIKRMGVSSALLEVCFIDNKEDMTIYAKNKDKIASLIADGIKEGFKLKDSDLEKVARDVIAGKYGNNPERKEKIEKAGYDYEAVRALVNKILKSS